MFKPKVISQKLGEADPIFSMGQRAWDLFWSQWPAITAFFATGGGVTFLAYVTSWSHALGPLGIGLIAIIISMAAYSIVSTSLLFASKRRLNRAHADAIEKWKKEADEVNPLDFEFNRKRISVAKLANPVTRKISQKRFIDCELMGPANIVLVVTRPGPGFTGVGFHACDIIVVSGTPIINNFVVFEDLNVIGGHVYNCTIYIDKAMIPVFRAMGAVFITLTGIPEIDNQSLEGAVGRTPP